MIFNEKQSKEIYEFIMKYNSEEEFKNNIQSLYDREINKLSILSIYALEEILRYGTKGIFNKFIESKGTSTEEQAVILFDEFIKLLNDDQNFKRYKMEQLKNSPETLSSIEILALSLINTTKSQITEEMIGELEYDPFNPILYSTDKQIRETLESLFLGEFIHQMLDIPSMKSIKIRQKENGRIANVDKPLIIEKIQEVIVMQEFMTKFKQAIDNRYVKVKMDILMGKGEKSFEKYLQYNTNISSNEIFGRRKDTSAEDMYNYFMDMMNKKRTK